MHSWAKLTPLMGGAYDSIIIFNILCILCESCVYLLYAHI